MGQQAEGIVEETLPLGLYRVKLTTGENAGEKIKVSIGGSARQTTVRVIAGSKVLIEVSELDPTRGKIISRLD